MIKRQSKTTLKTGNVRKTIDKLTSVLSAQFNTEGLFEEAESKKKIDSYQPLKPTCNLILGIDGL